jgi:hypothetical protein
MHTIGAACLYPRWLGVKQHLGTPLMAQVHDLSRQALKRCAVELRLAQLQQAHAARQRSLESAHEFGLTQSLHITDDVKRR